MTTMELDDLKTAWRELDRRLDSSLALNRHVLRELKLDKTRSALRRLAGLVLFELISGVLAALLLGSFLAAHFDTARFAVPAVVLHVVALLTIVAGARQLALIGRINYSGPVVNLQHELAALRASRVRTTSWLLLLSPLLWTPLAIVAAQGLFGFDVYRGFGPLWVASNIGVGLATIPLAVWIARRYSERLGGSRFLKHLADDIAGRSLATAMGHLEEITRFEEER
jgi:hypothetical protein